VFDTLCIPVLVTYDSDVVNGHKKVTEAYINPVGVYGDEGWVWRETKILKY
jgi:hypothetical protein